MVMYSYGGSDGCSGSPRCFNYVHILPSSFPYVSGVGPIFLFDDMGDRGKAFVHVVLCSVQGVTCSYR